MFYICYGEQVVLTATGESAQITGSSALWIQQELLLSSRVHGESRRWKQRRIKCLRREQVLLLSQMWLKVVRNNKGASTAEDSTIDLLKTGGCSTVHSSPWRLYEVLM